jgi:hypothetical protein
MPLFRSRVHRRGDCTWPASLVGYKFQHGLQDNDDVCRMHHGGCDWFTVMYVDLTCMDVGVCVGEGLAARLLLYYRYFTIQCSEY